MNTLHFSRHPRIAARASLRRTVWFSLVVSFVARAALAATPQSLAIAGPGDLYVAEAGVYVATVTYSDASTQLVTAEWSNSLDGATDVVRGYRFKGRPAPGNQVVITARYTEAGTTITATENVSVSYGPLSGSAATQPQIVNSNRDRPESTAGFGVNTATGAQVIDLDVLGVGGSQPFTVRLHYDSLFPSGLERLGPGWTDNWSRRLMTFAGEPGVITVARRQSWFGKFRYVETAAGEDVYAPVGDADQRDTFVRAADGKHYVHTAADGTQSDYLATNLRLVDVRNKQGQAIHVEDGVYTRVVSATTSGHTIVYHQLGYGPNHDNFLVDYLQTINPAHGVQRYVDLAYDDQLRLTEVTRPFEFDIPLYRLPSGTQIAVPADDPAGVEKTITVSRTDPIGRVRIVEGTIADAVLPQLTVKLISPTGTEATLIDRTEQRFVTTDYLSDVGSLGAFEGENPAGAWKVVFIDSVSGGSPITVTNFSIQFSPPTASTRFTYDDLDRIVAARDDVGSIFTDTYDGEGRVITQDDGVDTNEVMTFAYDDPRDGSLRTTVTDRTGQTTVYEHDASYDLRKFTDALGHATNYAYDDFGNRTAMTDVLGHTTTFDYDAKFNLTSVTDAAGATTIFEYR